MHLGVATLFVASVPLAVYVHCKRFFVHGASDAVAWLHFVVLAALLHVAVRAYAAWGGGGNGHAAREHFDDDGRAQQAAATFRGKQYDVSSFVEDHPGGETNLRKAMGRDIEAVWKANGVGWHIDNPVVMRKLKELEIK